MSSFGGGTFFANVAWGAGQGALVGGVDAAISGNDIGKAMFSGAIFGGAFAAINSGFQAYGNYKNGHTFRTNEGVIRNYINGGQRQEAIDFIQAKYGMTHNYQGNEVKMSYNQNQTEYGAANPHSGNIEIGELAFESPSILKATIVHEYAHSVKDRVLVSGKFANWQYPIGSFSSVNNILKADGPLGYANEIFNAGRLHITSKALIDANPLWFEWSKGFKWFNLIPHRFTSPVKLSWY